MTVRMRPACHVSLAVQLPLENAPRTSCYGNVILPALLSATWCQHPGEPWGLVMAELEGFLVHEGQVTAQPVTSRYELDENDDPMPTWLQPLLDQLKADLDRRERMA